MSLQRRSPRLCATTTHPATRRCLPSSLSTQQRLKPRSEGGLCDYRRRTSLAELQGLMLRRRVETKENSKLGWDEANEL